MKVLRESGNESGLRKDILFKEAVVMIDSSDEVKKDIPSEIMQVFADIVLGRAYHIAKMWSDIKRFKKRKFGNDNPCFFSLCKARPDISGLVTSPAPFQMLL